MKSIKTKFNHRINIQTKTMKKLLLFVIFTIVSGTPVSRRDHEEAKNYTDVSFHDILLVYKCTKKNIRKSMQVCYMLKSEEDCIKNLFSDMYFWS